MAKFRKFMFNKMTFGKIKICEDERKLYSEKNEIF